ncbi:MAG: hypothetical protein ACM3UR_04355 [Bacteroidota bacterium]|jgi:hypothetical protein|nr:hypothetical protein [Ignavibacteria bacterium]MCU7498332.1 hypothetical protein [Ignavibacteria bacterium]MCU7512685.1 hypothetical protein [Ignavibacteria bacterium]MCU7520226.1 hypothetical protein [Ignavibacteria bacterium]MCU7523653.1 hypothetical protein [Ignavibacteria bacterium]
MNKLILDTFLYVTDFELSSYRILDSLKNYNGEFNHNRLYPGLSELIELNLQLKDIDENNLNDIYIENFAKKKSKDERLMVETIEVTDDYIQQVVDLIEWAKPLIKEAIDEGKILYEFVKKNIYIEEIGIADASREEGYVLIPDNKKSVIQVLRYDISMMSTGKKSQRRLNTRVLQSVDKIFVNQAPNEVIMDLFEQFADMPNSSTFICTTDLDFPFTETILPVVKRKLMSRMAA